MVEGRLRLIAAGVMVVAMALTACSSGDASRHPPASGEAVRSSDPRATQLMYALSEPEPSGLSRRVRALVRSGDERFIAVFIELLRASQLGYGPLSIAERGGDLDIIPALEALSGKRYGADWERWVEWYAQSDLRPPPGFTGWKGDLLSRLDPGFGSFLRDGLDPRVRVEEIQWGGVEVDGIPALDEPRLVASDDAGFLTDDEPVIGLVVRGDARAYPLRIMDWHEMANDEIGGVAVSISYCTLCGSAIAYTGDAPDGTAFTFGSSGLLYRSNKLMYDRNTRTLWNQFTGEPLLGPVAGTDVRLERIPLVVTEWGDWITQHPSTTVLDIDTGYERPYELGAAYGDYFESPDTLFPIAARSDLLPTKKRVYGLTLDGRAKAYPLEELAREKVVNDRLGRTDLVLVATRGVVQVVARNRPEDAGDAFYEAGGEVRSYASRGLVFRPGSDRNIVIDQRDRRWRVEEGSLIGPDGHRRSRIAGQLAYWFGWFAFYPLTDVYGVDRLNP